MRKLTAGLFYSVDGVAEAPNLFQFDSFDAEMGEELTAVIDRVDTVLLGRVGYQQWSQFWPNAERDQGFADFINDTKKYVASTTLSGDLTWNNAELIDGDLETFVRNLKASEGGEIAVMGGMSLVRQLLLANLLDTLTLMVHPVIAGTGKHLFRPEDPTTRLALQGTRTTSKGNVLLQYGLRAEDA